MTQQNFESMWTGLWRSLGTTTGAVVTGVTEARACLADAAQSLSGGGVDPPLGAVEQQAEIIARILREHGTAPNRLGIDGLPGSGKSTLARVLASKLDLRWKSLDYRDLSLPENLQPDRTIFEHHRLFRTQNVDVFDALVYINESPARCRARTVRRGRGAVLAAVLDYDKLKRVGDLAFEVCDGKPIPIPHSELVLKIKPREGYRASENLTRRLRGAGLFSAGMSKEQMLFRLAYQTPEGGFMAYCPRFAAFAGLGGLVGWLMGPD